MPGTCSGCGKSDATTWCGGCKMVYYCSPACQTQDWQRHKQDCKKWRKRTNEPTEEIPCGNVTVPSVNKENMDLNAETNQNINKQWTKNFINMVSSCKPVVINNSIVFTVDNRVYLYEFESDKRRLFFKQDIGKTIHSSLCVGANANYIMIYNALKNKEESNMNEYQTKEKKQTKFSLHLAYPNNEKKHVSIHYSQLCVFGSSFYLIGGIEYGMPARYDETNKTFILQQQMLDIGKIPAEGNEILIINDTLLSMGGNYEHMSAKYTEKIWECDSNGNWSLSKDTLPEPMGHFGLVSFEYNQQSVVMVVGGRTQHGSSDSIYFKYPGQSGWLQSLVKSPERGSVWTFIFDDSLFVWSRFDRVLYNMKLYKIMTAGVSDYPHEDTDDDEETKESDIDNNNKQKKTKWKLSDKEVISKLLIEKEQLKAELRREQYKNKKIFCYDNERKSENE